MARVKGPSERYSKKQLTEMKTDLLRDAAKKWRIPVAAKKPTDLVRLIFKAQQAADGKQSSADRKTKEELRGSKRKAAPVVELEIDDDDSDIEIEEAPVATKKKAVKKAPTPAKATKKAPPKEAKKSSKKVVDEDEEDEEEQTLEEILETWLPEASALLVKLADYCDDTEVGPTIKKLAKLAAADEEDDSESEEEDPDEDEDEEESDEEEDDSEDEEDEDEEEDEEPAPKSKKKAAKKATTKKKAVAVDEDEDEEDDAYEDEDESDEEDVDIDMDALKEAKLSRLREVANMLNDKFDADIDTTTTDKKALYNFIVKVVTQKGRAVTEVVDDDEDKDGAGGAPDWLVKKARVKVKFEGEWYTGTITSVGDESAMVNFDEDDSEAEYDFEDIVPLKKKKAG